MIIIKKKVLIIITATLLLSLISLVASFPINGTLYSIGEQLDPSDFSHLTTINPINGQLQVLTDLSGYGASIGGSAYNAKRNEMYLVYSTYSIVEGCKLVTIDMKTNQAKAANQTMPFCTWSIAYDNVSDTLYGVVWNTKLSLQQVVSLDTTTGMPTIVCELPAEFGNKFGDSKLSSFNWHDGVYHIILDGNDYIGQYLFNVFVGNGTFTSVTINPDDDTYILPSLTWAGASQPGVLVGIGYIAQKGWWNVVSVDWRTAAIKPIGPHFAISESKLVWEYNTIYLFDHYYFLVVSDQTQKVWYVDTFDTNTGKLLYQTEITGSVDIDNYIPSHFLWLPSSTA